MSEVVMTATPYPQSHSVAATELPIAFASLAFEMDDESFLGGVLDAENNINLLTDPPLLERVADEGREAAMNAPPPLMTEVCLMTYTVLTNSLNAASADLANMMTNFHLSRCFISQDLDQVAMHGLLYLMCLIEMQHFAVTPLVGPDAYDVWGCTRGDAEASVSTQLTSVAISGHKDDIVCLFYAGNVWTSFIVSHSALYGVFYALQEETILDYFNKHNHPYFYNYTPSRHTRNVGFPARVMHLYASHSQFETGLAEQVLFSEGWASSLVSDNEFATASFLATIFKLQEENKMQRIMDPSAFRFVYAERDESRAYFPHIVIAANLQERPDMVVFQFPCPGDMFITLMASECTLHALYLALSTNTFEEYLTNAQVNFTF